MTTSEQRLAVLSPHHDKDDSDIRIIEHDGLTFVTHQELLNAGYRFLESFVVIKAKDKFYELQGHFGRDDPDFIGGAWWIEEVDPEAYFAEVETLTSQKQLALF